MANAEIEVSGLMTARGGRAILENIDLTIGKGRLVALIGPSGCGKTTLMRAMAGLDAPDRGAVLVDGERAHAALQRGRISMAFQDPALLPWLSCWRNAGWLALMRYDQFPTATVEKFAALVKLDAERDLKRKYPSEISGGERQRVALIRALSARSSVLLLDEPFSALDHGLRVQIVANLRERLLEASITCVLVTHDLRDALHFADEVIGFNVQTARFDKRWPVRLPRIREVRIRDDPSFADEASELYKWAG